MAPALRRWAASTGHAHPPLATCSLSAPIRYPASWDHIVAYKLCEYIKRVAVACFEYKN